MKTLVILFVLGVSVNGEDQQCKNPVNVAGTCVILPECPYLTNLRRPYPGNRDIINFLVGSQRSCGGTSAGRYPIVCCPFETSPVTITENSVSNTNTTPQTLSPRLLTAEEGCGFSNVSHTRTGGGESVKLGAWPWMALIGYRNNIDINWSCGGSLITTQHVLTAAHCLRSTLLVVRLGEHDLNTETETTPMDVDIVKVTKYPEYSPRDRHNDLAVLYMAYPVEITSKIRPICLPISGTIKSKSFVGYLPFVTGWGSAQEYGKPANVLQELQVPVLTNEVCKDRYRKVGKLISEQQFDEGVLCAGDLTGGKDLCEGDSGDPLMAPTIIDSDAYFYQIGIASYGTGCGNGDVPGVYTKVQTFVDWIEAIVAEPVE